MFIVTLNINMFCLKVAGNVKAESTGVISAIAHQVSKLEPSFSPPVILLEGDTRYYLLKHYYKRQNVLKQNRIKISQEDCNLCLKNRYNFEDNNNSQHYKNK